MAIIQSAKIATTAVELGVPAIYGFTISVRSETNEFQSLSNLTINTSDGSYTEAELKIINDFINLMTIKLTP